MTFQSTLSAWRATNLTPQRAKPSSFQSTLSAWRATSIFTTTNRAGQVSIHALRMEGDYSKTQLVHIVQVSIHALRMEGDRGKKPPCHSTVQQGIFANLYKCRLALRKKSTLDKMFTSASHRINRIQFNIIILPPS